MKCLWFNPDNDLALAAGKANYTPPKAAMTIRQSGALLPLWYGDEGDRVLCHGVNDKWLSTLQRDFLLGTDIFDHEDFSLSPEPWGWSLASRSYFIDEGFPASALPDDQWLAVHREKSSRLASAPIAKTLAESGISGVVAGYAIPCSDEAQILDAIKICGPDFVAKQPWSSSGRGVANSRCIGPEKALRFALESCKSQGQVMIEPSYVNRLDFAKLFLMHDGACSEVGTSVFLTDKNGAYSGNLLDTEQNRLNVVGQFADLAALREVTEQLEIELAKTYSQYQGILGVDMLITDDGLIDPVVEVNLRMTMGYVALKLSDSILGEGLKGNYSVMNNKGKFTPSDYEVRDGKIISGILNLVPPNSHFDFLVTIK